MIITLIEMGTKTYIAEIRRNGRKRKLRLTAGLRDAIQRRGRLVWATSEFGKGTLGEQVQYQV